jgi:hypothetical protein
MVAPQRLVINRIRSGRLSRFGPKWHCRLLGVAADELSYPDTGGVIARFSPYNEASVAQRMPPDMSASEGLSHRSWDSGRALVGSYCDDGSNRENAQMSPALSRVRPDVVLSAVRAIAAAGQQMSESIQVRANAQWCKTATLANNLRDSSRGVLFCRNAGQDGLGK